MSLSGRDGNVDLKVTIRHCPYAIFKGKTRCQNCLKYVLSFVRFLHFQYKLKNFPRTAGGRDQSLTHRQRPSCNTARSRDPRSARFWTPSPTLVSVIVIYLTIAVTISQHFSIFSNGSTDDDKPTGIRPNDQRDPTANHTKCDVDLFKFTAANYSGRPNFGQTHY